MKSLLLSGLLFLIPLLSYGVEVTIIIKGLRNSEGHIIIGVYPDATTFANPRKAVYYDNQVRIQDLEARVTFDLEKGTYAASMFHDENNNKELDLNLIKIPKEGWGFSRDAKPSPLWPIFEDASFQVEDESVNLTINVKYGIR